MALAGGIDLKANGAGMNILSGRYVYLIPLGVFIFLAMVFALSLKSGGGGQHASTYLGKSAPSFSIAILDGVAIDDEDVVSDGLAGSDGAMFSLDNLLGHEVSIVNFWASWCPPCEAEHDYIAQLSQIKDIAVFGVNYKDDPVKARQYLERLGNPYRIVGLDSKGRVGIDWGITGVPETFVLDAEGVVLYRHQGPITEEHIVKTLRPVLEKALGAEPSNVKP